MIHNDSARVREQKDAPNAPYAIITDPHTLLAFLELNKLYGAGVLPQADIRRDEYDH